ncbi:Stk1 family PASTA domain-containing Ser/Thr kinase [Rarobacter faecitabidus]|uniref:non-specific serine/threonine protein kinase n=1 Tax=Rarobacter faecitabidus TaxID=13243 RepID=A0A542ZP94_RARFA|nr:Stk1 family PASTA domain-containing Ser/Thr kinase [Rarobacter faecitabidus]TQL62178.1 serine/threonine-protein kinase [Rarobacter faecitabidus]
MVDQAPRILAGRYEVGALIGRGGMAEVHIGHDTRLGRTVAIKILRSDLARDPAFQARFRREAQAAASLNYQAIVGVYDTGEDNITDPATGVVSHVPFIVMEYVEGHTVRDILRDGNAVPIDEAVEITIGVLSALDYSHRAGIVHRDIKPANVMLTPTGEVKVMDFGIARALADSAATMTQTQAVIGTAQYLSPEQARGEQVDARSDLYSTGCLLFELLTGRPPFTGDSPVSVAYQHVREIPPPPSSIASDVPPVLDHIVAKALAKDRDNRYSSAAAFRADLEAAMKGLPVQATSAEAATEILAAPVAAPVAQAPTWNATPTGPVATNTAATQSLPLDGDEEGEDKSSKALMWTLISIAALAVIAIIAILIAVNSGKKEEPTVPTKALPSLIGMTLEEAGDALALQGFTNVDLVPKEEASAEFDVDTIIDTDPREGVLVNLDGAQITVTVSTGPSEDAVPELSNLTQDQARTALQNAGFEIETVGSEDSKDVPRDRVTRSEPEAGVTAEKGSTVKIWYSNGQVTVDDYVGRNGQDAKAEIEKDLGLIVTINEVETNDAKAGTVTEQSITAATRVDQRSAITLTVAKKIEKIQVPNVVGKTTAQAQDALAAANLTYDPDQDQLVYHPTIPAGQVISTSPKAGKKLDPGSVVVLTISLGPEPQNPTDPTNPGDTDADDGSAG